MARVFAWHLPEANIVDMEIVAACTPSRYEDFGRVWNKVRRCHLVKICLLKIFLHKYILLTHWGRVTHICVVNLTIIGSDNGLSPGRRQAIIWTNAWILLIGPLGTNFIEILIGIQIFSFKKMHLKMSSAKWRPFCLGLNVLITGSYGISSEIALLWLFLHLMNEKSKLVQLMAWCHQATGHNLNQFWARSPTQQAIAKRYSRSRLPLVCTH